MVSRSLKNSWKTPPLISNLLEKIKNLPRHQRVYILPTRHGLAFLVALFFLFLLALTYGHSLAFAAAFFLTSLLMSSALLTNLNLKGVEITQVQIPEVMRLGEFDDLQCLIKNKNKRSRFDLMVESWGSYPCSALVLKECSGGQEALCRSTLTFHKRGFYQAKKMTLSTSFPLGLFRAWVTFPLKSSVSIAPRAVEHQSINELWLDVQDEEQSHLSSSQDHGDDFYQHTSLQEGESWKKIDWKAWAKKDLFLKKEYQGLSQKIACYLQDHQNRENRLDFEQQLEQLSWWLKQQELSSQLFVVQLNFDTEIRFGPTKGKTAVDEILRTLAKLKGSA